MAKEVFDCPVLSCRVIDGDSQEIVLDRGWGVQQTALTRIQYIDAPERHTEAGKLVTQVVVRWLQPLFVPKYRLRWLSLELDKYGRSLGDLADRNNTAVPLSIYLLSRNLVREYTGEARGPWTPQELQDITDRCRAILAED